VLLALASAFCYGVSDFAGGLLSRRVSPVTVALAGQVGGLVVTVLTAPVLPTTAVRTADLGWGAVSGVGTGIGMLFLFRGLRRGTMSVVVPVSAIGGVALPVLVSVAFLGERPSVLAWLGIALAVPALWLVSRTGGTGPASSGVLDGIIAGVGIAVQYLALAQAGPGAGVWPLVAGRVAAIVTILPAVFLSRPRPERPAPRMAFGAAATGVAAALALACYLLATRQQLVAVAVVLSSLYPAIPVLLGITVLRERLTGWQQVALVGAAAAIVLLVV
jgi:drug/metabolite transporter (DMT)-like permease